MRQPMLDDRVIDYMRYLRCVAQREIHGCESFVVADVRVRACRP